MCSSGRKIYLNSKFELFMKTKLLTTIFLGLIITFVKAQEQAEWGKLRNFEKEMTHCPIDSAAEAVVLSDYEKIEIINGELTIQRHKRIKILKNKAKHNANISIPYYHSDGVDKMVTYFAQTINIENGKLIKDQVKRKEFFHVKINELTSELRFSFPNVKVGSIIEYKYTMSTVRYTSLKKWEFQSNLPTIYSQVTALIDSRFKYIISFQGTRLLEKYYKQGEQNSWSLTNLPAIKPEPFCPNIEDYIEQVNFQLESYYNSIGAQQSILKTWDQFGKDFIEDTKIQKILNKENKGSELINPFLSEAKTPLEKVKVIYNYVNTNFQWNRYIGLYPQKSFKEILTDKNGSAQEINLLLVLLLRSAGLEADPVLLSTKDHGIISKNLPFLDQFNLLICNVRIDDKNILLDASKRNHPYNLMPEENLNHSGLIVHESETRWIDIPINNKTRTFKMITMHFETPQEIQYKYEISCKAYDAINMREDLEEQELEDYFLENLIHENTEIAIDSISCRGIDDIEKSLYLTAFVRDISSSVVNDGYIYLNPFVDAFDDSNLFASNTRQLPIDFYYPYEKGYILNLTIPEGYEIVEIPESVNLKLPGDKVFFMCNTTSIGNKVMIRISISFKDHFFMPNEYELLKEIYDEYIEKRQEQIVLKKNT